MRKTTDTPDIIEPERYELAEPPAHQLEMDRRQFLETAGAGLLTAALAPAASGQASSPGAAAESRLRFAADGSVTLLTGKVEEGQGARTELAMAAAEELRLPVERIDVVMADTDQVPNDGITAGSRTTPSTVPAVRRAAAAARKGTPPADGSLTPVADWRVMGKSHVRLNAKDIVTGSHRFPSDVRRPGMLYGCVLRPPSYGSVLESVDLAEAKKMTGVTAVRDGEFAGCVAPTSFATRKAVEKLAASARWRSSEHPSSKALFSYLKEHARREAQGGRGGRAQTRGSVEQGMAAAKRRLDASYHVAYVQHAPMEPRAAVAEWQDGKLTVWTGTSNPFSVRDQLAEAFRLRPGQVRIIVPDMGGGFGGKHTGEVAVEAARLAREAGRPVSVRWTRAEEFMWAYFRPAALIEAAAGLDGGGSIVAWEFTNYNSGTAALDSPYRIANSRAQFVTCDAPLRQGSYRCLAATANNFARECFMDELAAGAGSNPLEFRLAHLDNGRLRAVLEEAADRFGWRDRQKKRKPGTGIGLACGTEKGSVVAACVEVELDRASGMPRVLEICEAFECGTMINPANVRQQVEGCILQGLGAVLREEIQFENGRLTNGSFTRYRVPRFRDVPKMEIVLIDRRDLDSVGAGETPIIAVAPAVANAVFQITGERVRAMPVRARAAKA